MISETVSSTAVSLLSRLLSLASMADNRSLKLDGSGVAVGIGVAVNVGVAVGTGLAVGTAVGTGVGVLLPQVGRLRLAASLS